MSPSGVRRFTFTQWPESKQCSSLFRSFAPWFVRSPDRPNSRQLLPQQSVCVSLSLSLFLLSSFLVAVYSVWWKQPSSSLVFAAFVFWMLTVCSRLLFSCLLLSQSATTAQTLHHSVQASLAFSLFAFSISIAFLFWENNTNAEGRNITNSNGGSGSFSFSFSHC